MKPVIRIAFVLNVFFLASCASLGLDSARTSRGDSDPMPNALKLAQERSSALEVEVARLQAENSRLAGRVEQLASERDRLAQTALELREAQSSSFALSDLGGNAPAQSSIALPKPQDDAVVDTADAPALRLSDVPVENAPRLVQPTLAAAAAAEADIFENESDAIATSSVLFGVHLASYRRMNEAREGWNKLQRENPDQLGLLEPRVEIVDVPERGKFMRLIGGGFSSSAKAQALCAQMKGKGLFCSVVDYQGEQLTVSG